jgi:Leucine-rich repeat (LRR) protein
MSEEFSVSKLEYLLTDMVNMSHNIMFVQFFPAEIVDDLWNNITNDNLISKNTHFHNLEISQLLLIAFASDESVPGRIRKGELYFSNEHFDQKGVLNLTTSTSVLRDGLYSEIINALNIHHVIIREGVLINKFFQIDFNLSLSKLKSISIVNIEPCDFEIYDVSKTLYVNPIIEEISLINVSADELIPLDLTQMSGLRKLTIINSLLYKLPKFNSNLEVLNLEKTDLKEIDFKQHSIQNLKELRITHGELTEIKNINSLINLKYLDVSRQDIVKLELDNLSKLEVVIARRNKLTQFPNINLSYSQLRLIDLSFNSIQLTNEIVEFPQLEQFIFEANYFPILDELFLPFQHVYRLDIAANDIVEISPVLSNFKRLSVLNLENNNIENVEKVIKIIPSDDLEIRLRGNNLTNQEKIKLINLVSKTITL